MSFIINVRLHQHGVHKHLLGTDLVESDIVLLKILVCCGVYLCITANKSGCLLGDDRSSQFAKTTDYF